MKIFKRKSFFIKKNFEKRKRALKREKSMVHAINRAQVSFPRIPLYVIYYDLNYESKNHMLVRARRDAFICCMS